MRLRKILLEDGYELISSRSFAQPQWEGRFGVAAKRFHINYAVTASAVVLDSLHDDAENVFFYSCQSCIFFLHTFPRK